MGKRVIKDHLKEDWHNIFVISSESPSGLAWKSATTPMSHKVKQGKPCGWQADTGHWKVEHKGKTMCVHRIVYHLSGNELDTNLVIDHIDGNPSNNAPENLRQVEFAVNMRNRKLQTNNSSGIAGVYETHDWTAFWREDGKAMHMVFKVSDFNGDSMAAKEAATMYRNEQIKRLNEASYGYTERHGAPDTK